MIRLLIFILFPLYLFSATTLSEGTNRYDDFTVSYFHDTYSHLQIEDVLDQDFQTLPNQFSLGYIEGTTWFKITLTNASKNNDFVLYFTEPLWEEFDLYQQQNDSWEISHAGLLVPLDQRQVNDVSPAFIIHIPNDQTRTIYVKGKSVSAQLGAFQIFTQEEFFRPTRFSITDLYLFYIIFILLVAFFNIYLFLARREKIYAFYISYVIALGIWISIKSGVYLIFGFNAWNDGLHASGTFIVLLLTLFSSEFLELKQRLPFIHRLFNIFAVSFGLLGIAITLQVPHTPLAFNIISSVFFTLLLIISIKVWREGHLKMRYYLIALIIYMPTMAMLTLTFNGFIENNGPTRYAFVLGSFIEVLFFNSLMVARYHSLFQDKINIQDELIKEKEKTAEMLADEIKLHIQELEVTNQNLFEQTKELERTQERLSIEATTDPLSQLYNRRYISQVAPKSFDAALRYGSTLSVMMIDLDDFKIINDTYGHAIGDKVIIQCADTLQKLVRSSDILARYGGEEFILIATHTEADEVLSLANRIRETIEKKVIPTVKDEELHYTLSIGISHLQEDDESIEQIIQRADKALYVAKANGKNRIEQE